MPSPAAHAPSPLETARRATGVSLAIFVALNLALATLGVAALAVLPNLGDLLWPEALGLLLAIGAVLRVVVGVGVLILWLGKLGFEDVGLVRGRLGPGIALSALIWGIAQAIALGLAVASTGAVQLHPSWSDAAAAGPVLGRLAGQILAVALIEEISFRGYLLPQIYLYLADHWPDRPDPRRYVALALSQGLFTVLHLPFLLHVGLPPADLPIVLPLIFGFGLFFSAVYLRTGNLFFAIGVHGLVTAPTPLFVWGGIPAVPIVSGTILVLAVVEIRRLQAASNQRSIL